MEIGPQFTIVPNIQSQNPYLQSNKPVEQNSMQEPPSVSITPAPPSKSIATRPNKLNIASPIRPAAILPTDFCNFGDVSATRLSASPG